MKLFHRSTVLFVLIVAMGCAPAAPSGGSGGSAANVQSPAAPKRILAAIRGAPASFAQQKTNPPGSGGSVPGTDALEELVHAGLVHRNDGDTLIPQLAQAVPSTENGLWKLLPDGRMETTFKILPTARWQDGAPLTTDDLLLAITVEQDRDMGVPRSAVYDLIESVQAQDARTMVVTWKQPYIEADAMFSYEVALPLPSHLLGQVYADDKANFFSSPYWVERFVGAGPFKLVQWVPDSHVILQANDLYVPGRPKLDEIELRFIPDSHVLMTNILAGVELTIGRALSFDQAMQIRDQWQDGTPVNRAGGWARITPQFMNPSPAIIADVRFRQALLRAIDRQQMVESLLAGQSSVAHSFLSPDQPEYREVEPSIVKYEYDPRRAAAGLQDLGYTKSGDGFFADERGQRLSVEIRTTVLNDLNTKSIAPVADDWQRLGVGVDQVIIPLQRFEDREYRATYPGFDLLVLGNRLAPRDLRTYHSSFSAVPENNFQLLGNNARYQSPELDSLIDRYVTTIPRAERVQILGQIVAHQTSLVTYMGLIFNVNPTMVGRRLHNVHARSNRATEAWNAQEWDVA